MTLSSKFIFSFLLVNLLAIATVALAVNFTTSRALSRQVGTNLHNLATSEGLAIGALLQHQVELLQTLSVNEIFINRIQLANSQYADDESAILADLEQSDAAWRTATETDRAVQLVLTNSSASELLSFQARFPDHTEILITDQYGATVAATQMTDDFYQADEVWWQAAYAHGEGAIYLSSESAGGPAGTHLMIAVPLMSADGAAAIGVLRSTYELTATMARLRAAAQTDDHQTLSLLLPSQTILMPLPMPANGGGHPLLAVTELSDHIVADLQADTYQHVSLNQVPVLASLAPVDTLDASTNLDRLTWHIMATQEREVALASVTAQQRTIWVLATLMMLAVAFSAVITGKRLTTPIVRLTETAQQIRDGQLDIRANIDSNDEIGVLAHTFNSMTGRLRRSIAQLEEHRDQLEERVAERTAELARQSQMWDVVLSTTPNFFFIFDQDGRVTYASPPAQAAMDVTMADIKGQHWQDLPLALPQHLQDDLNQVFAGGMPLHGEFNMVVAAEARTFEYTLNPVRQADDVVTSIVATVRDVTTQKAARENLLHSQKMESLGILAGGVAHDFNNLLVAMLSQTALAASRLDPASPAREHIEKATTAANRAADLTRQLLAYSGKATFVMKPIQLQSLIEESLHLFEIGIPKQIELDVHFPPDMAYIVGDYGQIQQIIMNLILNAAEAIGEHPGRITIAASVIDLEPQDDRYWQLTKEPLLPGPYIRLTVADTGTGMDGETLQNIFDPFFTTKFTGRGLGLAAVLGIVRGHLGGIHVQSEVGEGTRFELIFPVSDVQTVAKSPPAIEQNGALKTGTILVVDDEAPVREAVVDILTLAGLTALTAHDGNAAVDLYEAHGDEIDLILLDLSMPGLTGQQTFFALRELDPGARILLSSGFSESEITRQFRDGEAIDFLPKPYDMDMLVAKITKYLR